MNTQKGAARRYEEGIANAGAQHNQVLPLDEVVMEGQVFVAPSSIEDKDITEPFL